MRRSIRSKLLKRDKFPVQRVRALTGRDAIESRTIRLTGTATEEVVFVTGDVSVVTENLAEIQAAVPDATPFVSGLDWLRRGYGCKRHGDWSAPSDRPLNGSGNCNRPRLKRGAGNFG